MAKAKVKKSIPYAFVLEELDRLSPHTKPMFGFTGVYVGEKIVFCLREGEKFPEDNGVWLATFREHHPSLQTQLPSMKSLIGFGGGVTDWQVIPSSSPTFEAEAIAACELVLKGDSRIGKVPKSRRLPKRKSKRPVKRQAK